MRGEAEALVGGPERNGKPLGEKAKMRFDSGAHEGKRKRSEPFQNRKKIVLLIANGRATDANGDSSAGFV